MIQSGGFGNSLVVLCAAAGIGFRQVVASGSESDLTAPDLVEAMVDDPGTRLILMYMEGISDGRRFVAVAERALAAGKPIVVWKAGNTRQGEAIIVRTYWFAWSEIGSEPEKWNPTTRETADHSIPFLVAAALLYDWVEPSTYAKERKLKGLNEGRLSARRLSRLLKLCWTLEELDDVSALVSLLRIGK